MPLYQQEIIKGRPGFTRLVNGKWKGKLWMTKYICSRYATGLCNRHWINCKCIHMCPQEHCLMVDDHVDCSGWHSGVNLTAYQQQNRYMIEPLISNFVNQNPYKLMDISSSKNTSNDIKNINSDGFNDERLKININTKSLHGQQHWKRNESEFEIKHESMERAICINEKCNECSSNSHLRDKIATEGTDVNYDIIDNLQEYGNGLESH